MIYIMIIELIFFFFRKLQNRNKSIMNIYSAWLYRILINLTKHITIIKQNSDLLFVLWVTYGL